MRYVVECAASAEEVDEQDRSEHDDGDTSAVPDQQVPHQVDLSLKTTYHTTILSLIYIYLWFWFILCCISPKSGIRRQMMDNLISTSVSSTLDLDCISATCGECDSKWLSYHIFMYCYFSLWFHTREVVKMVFSKRGLLKHAFKSSWPHITVAGEDRSFTRLWYF